jgi:hypothetical protein
MTAKLSIHIDRGGMPRNGLLNKPFDLQFDDQKLGALSWGERKSYTIPAGAHRVTLKYRRHPVTYQLDIQAAEGGTVSLDSQMDMHGGGFTLFNPADGTRSGIESQEPKTIEEMMKRQRASSDYLVEGFCGMLGMVTFFILNLVTHGRVPGGFIGGFLGAVIGGLVGLWINKIRKKQG